MSYVAATFSNSGSGSTPGNKTKNMGVVGLISLNASNVLKVGYSTYLSPISSATKLLIAEVNLSGLIVLKISNLWNFFKSLNALGKSTISAFSSLYHFFH